MNTTPSIVTSAPVKLTNWKNPPTVEGLKRDLQFARSSHDAHKSKVNTWRDNLYVTGSAKVTSPKGSSQLVPKLIRKQAEWRYPALSEPFLSTDDVFNVYPVTWEDKPAAIQNQMVLNHQFNNQIDKIKFIDEYVRAVVNEGTAVIRVGWEFEEETAVEEVPVFDFVPDENAAQLHEQLAQMWQTSPSQYFTDVPEELQQAHEMTMQSGIPMSPVQQGTRKEKKTKTVKNQPTLQVCNIDNVIIDPSCLGDADKAKFIIYSFESSLSELKKSGKYQNLDRIDIDTNNRLGDPYYSTTSNVSAANSSFNFDDKPRKKFVVYEYWGYWDIDGSGLVKPFVATWVGDTMIRLEENPFPDKKLPFVVVPYLPVARSVYGEPDGELLEDNQKVLGAVMRGMIDIMGKSANGQTGMRKDMLDATNRRKFDKGMDYEFNANVDPRQGVFMHTYPEIPNSAQFMLQLQNMEAESLTGVKTFNQGISGAALGDVAASVRGALDAASKRELNILRRLSNGIIKIGKKIIAMNADFLSEKEVIRVTNEEFVTIRREDLVGSFDLRLSISTAEEDNNKAEQLAFMLQTIGNNMDPAMSRMILSDIARLRKMPELAEKIENFQPEPDPIQQEMAQLQLELLRAQVAAENAKAQKLMAEAQLGGAKIGTEQAKAANLSSDTDLKNLDFVEQESGVKQERDLQLAGRQAESQMLLKEKEHQIQREKMDNDLVKEYVKAKAKPKPANASK